MSQSNNTSNNKEEDARPRFTGDSIPMNVNLAGMDDGAEETTRRIGGGVFMPSFEPIPMPVETRFVGGATTKTTKRAPAMVVRTAEPPKRGIWQLRDVPVLPELYVLERTAVFVPHADPQDVSMRISEVLRERSIEAVYDNVAAKAKCLTADGVDFRIRLFRGRGSLYDHGIIVEVQRRFGTSNIFFQETTAILDAAQDKVPPPPSLLAKSTTTSNALPLVSTTTTSGGADNEGSPPDNDVSLRPSSSLNMVSKMLSHRGYDTKHLALQMLISLTDPAKIGAKTAQSVSAEFLKFDNDDDDNELTGRVLSFILDKKVDDDMAKLRALAFQATANAVQAVHGNISPILKEQFRFVVADELREAKTTPRNALQAARIAEFLVPEDTGSDLHNALEMAFEVGAARHAALQRQAQLCLDKLTQ